MVILKKHLGPFELGERPEPGKRNDIKEIFKEVKAGKTNGELLEITDGTAARYERMIKFMRFTHNEQQSDRQLQGVRVLVLWGATGAGKTYAAVNVIANGTDYYIAEAPSVKGSKLWFDGYEGQRILILDDFDGDYCTMAYLKRLLDKYKLKIEVKGGFAWATWTTVIITSNHHPADWYKGNGVQVVDTSPLERRIAEIRYCEHQGAYKVQNWDKSFVGEDFVDYVCPASPNVDDLL